MEFRPGKQYINEGLGDKIRKGAGKVAQFVRKHGKPDVKNRIRKLDVRGRVGKLGDRLRKLDLGGRMEKLADTPRRTAEYLMPPEDDETRTEALAAPTSRQRRLTEAQQEVDPEAAKFLWQFLDFLEAEATTENLTDPQWVAKIAEWAHEEPNANLPPQIQNIKKDLLNWTLNLTTRIRSRKIQSSVAVKKIQGWINAVKAHVPNPFEQNPEFAQQGYYIRQKKQDGSFDVQGPFEKEQMIKWIRSGKLKQGIEYSNDGGETWRVVGANAAERDPRVADTPLDKFQGKVDFDNLEQTVEQMVGAQGWEDIYKRADQALNILQMADDKVEDATVKKTFRYLWDSLRGMKKTATRWLNAHVKSSTARDADGELRFGESKKDLDAVINEARALRVAVVEYTNAYKDRLDTKLKQKQYDVQKLMRRDLRDKMRDDTAENLAKGAFVSQIEDETGDESPEDEEV